MQSNTHTHTQKQQQQQQQQQQQKQHWNSIEVVGGCECVHFFGETKRETQINTNQMQKN